ncbi:MAG TPA: ribose-5-phosphate isomerase RpiA [Planctomycetota bacterium]|nr:ribose-5-phosphate isomerase RpiA [Planctomycetota bacterium]
MLPRDRILEALGERAQAYIHPGAAVGLGTGQAASAFIDLLARRVRGGLRIRAVATSVDSERRARAGGIRVLPLEACPRLDVVVDGADEVSPALDLLKGYGGALVREKIVAAASVRRIILVTPEKLVPALGSRGKLPVEVLPFAAGVVRETLEKLGYPSRVRRKASGTFRSDNGNVILDCRVTALRDPRRVDRAIREIPGVVGTGLFLGMATLVLVGRGDGTVEIRRRKPGRT